MASSLTSLVSGLRRLKDGLAAIIHHRPSMRSLQHGGQRVNFLYGDSGLKEQDGKVEVAWPFMT